MEGRRYFKNRRIGLFISHRTQLKFASHPIRVIGLLIAKGYMELEESVKQWKQKTHLLRILEVESYSPCLIGVSIAGSMRTY